jgi:hypothetical protein
MGMVDIQHPFYYFLCPFVYISFAASAAYSAVAFEMGKDMLIAIRTIIVEISFAWVITKKHRVNFMDLLRS